MGKKSSGSWFTAVKRAITRHRSNSAKTQNHDDNDEDNNILQKPNKRRWLFRNSSTTHVQQQITHLAAPEENYHAEATMKVAEPAATTVHAAAEIIRFTTRPSSISVNHHFAATLIQTSFRGYLARRASRALKGIVMLQAVIRGQNVRKQAVITLRCMQALIRVQSRVHGQRSRLSHEGHRKSMMSENASFCELKYIQDIRQRKSMARDGTYIPDGWSDRPHNVEENQWITAKQWENQRTNRASLDRWDSIKTIEMDSSRPSSRSGSSIHKPPIPNSPSRRSSYSPSVGQQPITPSPVKTVVTVPLQIRSASPRCLKEERSYLNANIRLTPRVMGSVCRYSTCTNDMTVPNYMATTESAKARIRSQSTPRQRPSTPERERGSSVKKRLAYPVQEPCDNYNGHNLRSPSLKSVQAGHVGMGQHWYSADSTTGGEISPCSTTDLRRRLR